MKINPKISIIIPTINDFSWLKLLIEDLNNQEIIPYEIIIADSSSNNEIQDSISFLSTNINIKYIRVGRAFKGDGFYRIVRKIFPKLWNASDIKLGRSYPYEATNMGVKVASGEWLAFLDCTTFPKKSWLQKSLSKALSDDFDIIFGKTKYYAKSRYQRLFRAATWGAYGHESMPGTIMKRKLYFPIKEGVRAGGDIEWRTKAKALFKFHTPASYNLRYFNVPKNLLDSSKKMFIYQLHSARVNIQHRVKDVYFGIFILGITILVPKWNSIVGWESSPLFIPNITKIYLISLLIGLLSVFIIDRGIFLQIRQNNFLINILKFALIIILFFSVYNWNAAIAGWVEDSVWFIPHITKIFIFTVFLSSFLYRGIYFPIKNGIRMQYLFPMRFIMVGILGIFNDLIKAPGYLLGSIFASFKRK